MTTTTEALAHLATLAEHVEVVLTPISPIEAVALVPDASWSTQGTGVHPWLVGRVGNVTISAFPAFDDPDAHAACVGAVEAARQLGEVSA